MIWKSIKKLPNLLSLLLVLGLIIFFWVIYEKQPVQTEYRIGYTTDTVMARVTGIIEEGEIQLGDVKQTYQVANVMILEGEHANDFFTIDYGKRSILSTNRKLIKNERVMVMLSGLPEEEIYASFIDFIRIDSLLILGIVFVVICVLVSRWKGVRSLLGTALSILVILYFIIPQINAGQNPILISLIGSFVFLALSQYLVYGWTLKTHISIAGILIAVLITGLLAAFSVNFSQLNGSGDESAIYLLQLSENMNIKNLLIAGIIVGSLGILDDLIISQTSVVIEIYRANPDMLMRQRFGRAMNVGRDHIAATVNTLVLAYLGASLPLFILFTESGTHILTLLNQSILAEEIVRTLVGTIGLFLSVPITTFIACWVVDKPNRLEKLVAVFGPLLSQSEVLEPHHH